MKTFWKIIGGIVLLLIVLIVGVDLYFTSERLKNTVLPYVSEAVGKPVRVESMSLSFFKTFPHPGIKMKDVYIPGDAKGDTVFSADRIVTGVKLFPLLSNNLDITELVVNHPVFTYKIYADSTTNLDFYFNQPDTTQSESYRVNIPYFEISNGRIGYDDDTSQTSILMQNLDGDLSLNYADSIASKIDVEVGKFSATFDSANYVSGLPISLSEKSTIFPDKEMIRLQQGHFNIRRLQMDLSGTLSNWSDALRVNLQFNSSSDNFGELLQLLPKSYAKYTKDLKAKGKLDMGGTIHGVVAKHATPNFNIHANVQNGYLKNPDLSQPIRHIQLAASATNNLVTIDTLNAEAGVNRLKGSGRLTNPLGKHRTFETNFLAKADLSTLHQFMDLSDFNIAKMAGTLNVNANAEGSLDHPKNTKFNGKAILSNGMMHYKNVPKAIRDININASGSQNLLTIKRLGMQAAQNTLSAHGKIQHLLDANSRRIENMKADLNFDLATLKDFYPIDKDTLKLDGKLTAHATLNGKAAEIARAVQSGNISLKNGIIDYKKFDSPLRHITLNATLNGPKMRITKGHLETGKNSLDATGSISDYLSDNRSVNLNISGNAKLKELSKYYDLKPGITDLNGDADFNLSVKGQLSQPSGLNLSGRLNVKKGQMAGKSFHQPVKNLNGTFTLSPQKATLKNLTFMMGSSDFDLQGTMNHYMQYLKNEKKRTVTPSITGRYHSKYVNVDELMDWSDTTSTFTLKLPDVNSNISVAIDSLTFVGAGIRNLQAKAATTPQKVHLVQAKAAMFKGQAKGSMDWQIPDGKPSTFHFKGSLDGLQLQSFFKQYPILGQDSRFYKYISGRFSAGADYTTKIDTHLNPLISTTVFNGSFNMKKARIQNHPLQQKLANYTKINELKNVALDSWQSKISVKNNVLTIKNLSLTSRNIGLDMSGTQNLQSDKINFHVALMLPGGFKDKIGSVISAQAANALSGGDGRFSLPLQVNGTYGNPKISPDQSMIKNNIKNTLQNKAKNKLKGIFNRGKKKTQTDTTRTDTTGSE